MTMPTSTLPAFMGAPLPDWPWPQPLAQVSWVARAIDHRQFSDRDFQASGVTPPAALQRAVPKRLAQYLAGRVCAREALAQQGIQALPTMDGDGAPRWPDGVVGTITHQDTLAAALVGPASHWQGLGVDAEKLLSDAAADDLSAHILTCQERRRLQSQGLGLQVTLAFSLKESLFKALYPLVKQRFYFDAAELLDWQPTGSARLQLLQDLSPQWRAGAVVAGQFSVQGGLVLTQVAIAAG